MADSTVATAHTAAMIRNVVEKHSLPRHFGASEAASVGAITKRWSCGWRQCGPDTSVALGAELLCAGAGMKE